MILFRDRSDAGRRLEELLKKTVPPNSVILAIARGGVIVAQEIAQRLDLPLHVLVTRKIGTTQDPELGIGALSELNVSILDQDLINYLKIPQEEIDREIQLEKNELARRIALYRNSLPLPLLHGKTALVVDDGIATGITSFAATETARKLHAETIILAAPICARETAEKLQQAGVSVISCVAPQALSSIGYFYSNFSQITDQEIITILTKLPVKQNTIVR